MTDCMPSVPDQLEKVSFYLGVHCHIREVGIFCGGRKRRDLHALYIQAMLSCGTCKVLLEASLKIHLGIQITPLSLC